MLRPKDVTDQLGISAPTLRVWSNTFAPVLSPAAQASRTESGGSAQRRYTQQDVAYFRRAKQLLDGGRTFDETLTTLQTESPPEAPADVLVTSQVASDPRPADDGQEGVALIAETHPVIGAFEAALRSKDETIQVLQQSLARKEGDLQLMQMATQDIVVTKEAVITAKDQVIEQLKHRVDEFVQQPASISVAAPPPAVSKPTFRWTWLNRLLTAESQSIG